MPFGPQAPPGSSTSPDPHNSMRTYKAAQGRKPKIKITIELSTPIFIEDEKGRLQLSKEFGLVAKALGL